MNGGKTEFENTKIRIYVDLEDESEKKKFVKLFHEFVNSRSGIYQRNYLSMIYVYTILKNN